MIRMAKDKVKKPDWYSTVKVYYKIEGEDKLYDNAQEFIEERRRRRENATNISAANGAKKQE